MQLSVVLPAYNEEATLDRTLRKTRSALEANDHLGISWEIVVCDNNSTDRTAEIAREHGATVIHEPVNQISRARNTGAAASRGQWLLFLDADSYPPPGLIAETIEVMQSDDGIGCSSTIQVEDGPWWYRASLEGHNLEMRLFRTGVGVYLLCRAEAFRQIGGFSTDLFALEELEFLKRLKAHARQTGTSFRVLYRHPVVTSGRKGRLHSKWSMSKSVLRALWHLITGRPARTAESLPYWYDGKR